MIKTVFSKTNIFSKHVFPNLHQIQKQDILLKHSVYGYDPLHNQDEISMFLTLSSKLGFGLKDVNMNIKNQTCIFLKENLL